MSVTKPQDAAPRVPSPRMDLPAAAPEAYQAMLAFAAAAESRLDPVVANLVKVHAARLNGCAFCSGLQSAIARNAGETEQRLAALDVWSDADVFDDRERAALALAEAVTFVAEGHVPDEVYRAAAECFDDVELAHLLWTIAAVNALARMGVSTRLPWHD